MTVTASAPSAGAQAPFRRADEVLGLLVVTLVLAAMIGLHLHWIGANHTPPVEDDNMQLVKSLEFHRALTQDVPSFVRTSLLGHFNGFYPHLVYLVTTGFYTLSGESEGVARASLLPFLALLAYSTFFLAGRLWGPPAGVAASVATLTAAATQHYSHSYFLDLPLTAVVAFHLAALVGCDGFRSRRGTLLWGLSLAAGLMTKWTFALWVALPDALILAAWLRRERGTPAQALGFVAGAAALPAALASWFFLRERSDLQVVDLWILSVYAAAFAAAGLVLRRRPPDSPLHGALLLAGILTLPWYVENLAGLIFGVGMAGDLASRLDPGANLSMNWHFLAGMVWGLGALLGLAALTAILRRDLRFLWLAAVCASGVLLFSWGFVAAERYVLPALPALSALAYSWIRGLARWGWGVVAVLLAVWGWQAVGWLPGAPAAPAWGPRLPPAPGAVAYPIREVLARIVETAGDDRPIVWVMNGEDRNLVQARTFEYVAYLHREPVFVLHVEPEGYPPRGQEHADLLKIATHLLVVESEESPVAWDETVVGRAGWSLEPAEEFPLPGGYRMSLFRRVP